MSASLDPLHPAASGDSEHGIVLWSTRLLGAVCALALAFIMGLTFVDVFMRYVFSRPITGSSELVMFAMAILIFSVFPIVTYREQHISVGILRGRLRGMVLRVQHFVVSFVSFVACATIAWQLMHDGQQLTLQGQRTMVLELPLGALSSFMGAMSAVSAVALLIVLLRQLGVGRTA